MWGIRARRTALAVLFFGLSGCSRAAAPPPDHVIAEPAVVDYGEVATLPVPFHRAKVRLLNGTDTSYVVRDIQTSDGLKIDMASGAILPAHGEGQVVIILDSRDRQGTFSGEVTIVWENEHPALHLPVRAAITSREDVAAVTGPNLVVDGPRDWDFGTIQRQAVEYFDFYVKNTGTAPVVLQSIETKCGCVQAWADERTIPPGGRLPIHARVTASVYPGNHPEKTITIVSNDPDTPIISLFVHGFIQDTFTIEPAVVEFGEIEPGTVAERRIVVRANHPDVPKATDVVSTVGFLEVSRNPEDEGEQGVVAVVTVRLRADAPPGPFDARVRFAVPDVVLSTSTVADPEVPVRGTIGGALPVVPTSVNFGIVTGGESVVRRLRVLEVADPGTLRVDCQLNYLTATVEPDAAGPIVILRYEPKHGEGTVVGQVVVTDTATARSRTIPVALQFQAAATGDGSGGAD